MNLELKIQKLEALRADILSGVGYPMGRADLMQHAKNIADFIEALSQHHRPNSAEESSDLNSILTVLSVKSGWSNDQIKEIILDAGIEFLTCADPENAKLQSLNTHFWTWWETRIYRVLAQLNNSLPFKKMLSNRHQIQQAIVSEIKRYAAQTAYGYRFLIDKI